MTCVLTFSHIGHIIDSHFIFNLSGQIDPWYDLAHGCRFGTV